MNIAIFGSRGFPSTYGGFETLVRYLARDWTERGHTVTVYCRTRNGGNRWVTEGVRCQWTPGRDSMTLSTLSFGATSIAHGALHGYDGALVLNVANGYFLPLLRARGIPCAVNTDGIEWERGKWGPTARRAFIRGAKLCARYADVLIADSEAIAAIWEERFGVRPRFIPYGAPVLSGVGAERLGALGLEPHSYALAVARLIPENNVELFLDALATMPASPPAVVVGSANFRSPLERRLRELDERGAVRWLGHVADQELLMELWGNCGVYVHGHSVGGTNPSLLQALGAGAPTLALDTVFNREVIGSDGQLYPPDPDRLAREIADLLADQARRDELAARGREIVGERYRWSSVCDGYLEAIESAREPGGSRGRARRPLREPAPARR